MAVKQGSSLDGLAVRAVKGGVNQRQGFGTFCFVQNNFAQAALAVIRDRDGVTVDEAIRAALLSWAARR